MIHGVEIYYLFSALHACNCTPHYLMEDFI